MIIPTEVVSQLPVGGIAVVGQSCASVLKKGILVGRALFETKQNVIPLRVVNASDTPQTIYKGTLAAECEVVPSENVFLLSIT
jgi:hypothetical protein